MDLLKLKAHFPDNEVLWRAQSLTRDGSKAMALAYIDARHVMDRLDDVCGPGNWQTRHTETPRGRVMCEIGIRFDGEWVWKSDGAGETDVEGEKGAISDALKRAAVSWGVGRYLYDMPAPWVPCESYERNGKKVWKGWKSDPWRFVKSAPREDIQDISSALLDIRNADTMEALLAVWSAHKAHQQNDEFVSAKNAAKLRLSQSDIQSGDGKHYAEAIDYYGADNE